MKEDLNIVWINASNFYEVTKECVKKIISKCLVQSSPVSGLCTAHLTGHLSCSLVA